MSDGTFDRQAFIAGSFEGLQLLTQSHIDGWGFDKIENWSLDQDEGVIRFVLENGMTASAPAQIVGTWSENDNSFMWGWDHPSVVPALQKAAWKVHEFGREHDDPDLTTQIVPCEQVGAWEFTAVAVRINHLSGAYRGPAGDGVFVFIAFGDVTLRKT